MLNFVMTLHGRTVSANKIYEYGRGRVYLTAEAKAYKLANAPKVRKAWREQGAEWTGGPLFMSIRAHDNWFNKDDSVKRIDVDNLVKLIQDTIFQALDIDDSNVFYVEIEKVQEGLAMPFVTVHIKEKKIRAKRMRKNVRFESQSKKDGSDSSDLHQGKEGGVRNSRSPRKPKTRPVI